MKLPSLIILFSLIILSSALSIITEGLGDFVNNRYGSCVVSALFTHSGEWSSHLGSGLMSPT